MIAWILVGRQIFSCYQINKVCIIDVGTLVTYLVSEMICVRLNFPGEVNGEGMDPSNEGQLSAHNSSSTTTGEVRILLTIDFISPHFWHQLISILISIALSQSGDKFDAGVRYL